MISSTIFTLDKAKRAFVLFSLNQNGSFWSVFVSFGLTIHCKNCRNFANEISFPACEEIAPGLYFIEAKGHTKGNSIVILEHDGLYYMFHGDITYCDAALKANRLSIIFEDKTAARETLDRVRTFIKNNPTVYLSTYCPEEFASMAIDLGRQVTIIDHGDHTLKMYPREYVDEVVARMEKKGAQFKYCEEVSAIGKTTDPKLAYP